MDQGSIKPGLRAVSLEGKVHPLTGEPLKPIGYLRNGTALWPIMGGAPDEDDDEDGDENDSRFTDEDDDSEDQDADEEDSDEASKSKKPKKDNEDEDDDKPRYTESEMYAVKRRMRKADQRASRLEQELRDIKTQLSKKETDTDDTKPNTEQLTAAQQENERLRSQLQSMRVETAFSRIPLPDGEQWIDLEDAIAAAQRLELLDDVIDEDGTVDKRSLRAALKELRRRKPHLIKKVSEPDEEEDQGDEEGQRPKTRRTASTMNGKRKGDRGTKVDREELAKKFPALHRR